MNIYFKYGKINGFLYNSALMSVSINKLKERVFELEGNITKQKNVDIL